MGATIESRGVKTISAVVFFHSVRWAFDLSGEVRERLPPAVAGTDALRAWRLMKLTELLRVRAIENLGCRSATRSDTGQCGGGCRDDTNEIAAAYARRKCDVNLSRTS